MVDGAPLPISDETRARIEAEIAKMPEKRGALLAALHLVQAELGHVSVDTARGIAEWFEIQPVEVLELVSFYNMFYDQAQGRHHVHVCTNLSCALRGARELVRGLEAHLGVRAGRTTSDGRITLGHEECLGACAYAPMMRVSNGRGSAYHEDLDVEKAKTIVDALE